MLHISVHLLFQCVRNKTIIGLKFAFPTFANDEVTVRNKTIIGLKFFSAYRQVIQLLLEIRL